MMDPLGFALENFDAIGEWRSRDRWAGTAIDASGQLVDGTAVSGPGDLRKALVKRPEQFVETMTEKLMTYALGRSVEYLRHARRQADRARCRSRQLPFFVDRDGNREERAVSDAREAG